MKKLILSLIAGAVLASGAAAQNASKSKTIVCYFSASSSKNTERLAKTAAKALGADLHEIVPVHIYTEKELDGWDKNALATRECYDDKARPAIANSIDLSDYETVILAYPIWWYMAPKIMYTFVESNNLKGKNVVTICTSGGSGLGRSGTDLMKHTDGAIFKGGKRFSAASSESEVKNYIEGLLNK